MEKKPELVHRLSSHAEKSSSLHPTSRTPTRLVGGSARAAVAAAHIVALVLASLVAPPARAQTAGELRALVAEELQWQVANGAGVAVALRKGGRTHFFNFGLADQRTGARVTADSIFNLASTGKLFASTLLARGVVSKEIGLDDPVSNSIPELRRGGDITRVTLGQIASHTSGLPRQPAEKPPGPERKYSLPEFLDYLAEWRASEGHLPGRQYIYSNSGLVLLRVALARHYKTSFQKLMDERTLKPLGMSSTSLPPLPESIRSRVVQGYGPAGRPIGMPGSEIGIFGWDAAGQVYSSARDMAAFLTAAMGEAPGHAAVQDALRFARQPIFEVNPHFTMALTWQRTRNGPVTIVDKNGGLPNTSTYIGLIPERRVGIVILCNRGKVPATAIGRRVLMRLVAADEAQSRDGVDGESADIDDGN